MALVLADRVQETTTTTGTGTITLAGAVSGYQSFSVIGNGNTTYYTIADQAGSNWEVGIGTYTLSGTTLARTTVLASSNSGSLVNFTSGTKNVFVTYPAGYAVNTQTGTATAASKVSNALTAGTGISYSSGTTFDGSAAITINNAGVTSITGTSNQITASASTGGVTLSTPQSINTTASVQFGSFGVGTAASGTTGEIRATNNVTAYYSDERLKTKVGDIENPLGKVHAIKTMLYHANEIAVSLGYDASIQEVGVSAQSVQAVQPEAVAPAPIDEQYLTVRYEKLVPLLIEAIKALDQKVDALAKELK
jgi:Chaperone of endosialidase